MNNNRDENNSNESDKTYKAGMRILSGRPVTVFEGYMPDKFIKDGNLSKVTVEFNGSIIPLMLNISDPESPVYIRKVYIDMIRNDFVDFMDEFGITYTVPDSLVFKSKKIEEYEAYYLSSLDNAMCTSIYIGNAKVVYTKEHIKISPIKLKNKSKNSKKKKKVKAGKNGKYKRTQPKMTPGFKVPGFRRNIGLWS